MARLFLKARWQDLVIVTYAVPRELLLPRLPPGLELDLWEGRACASIVAFDFRRCAVRGVCVPGLTNFPEINLRFYVRESGSGRRGVVFIREYVPSRVISLVARVVYNEPYRAAAMASTVRTDNGNRVVQHRLEGLMEVTGFAAGDLYTPTADSAEHFFKEHSWGYGLSRRGHALVYEVKHPLWRIWRNASAQVSGHFGLAYGSEWRFLADAAPINTLIAEGSEIEVWGHARL